MGFLLSILLGNIGPRNDAEKTLVLRRRIMTLLLCDLLCANALRFPG